MTLLTLFLIAGGPPGDSPQELHKTIVGRLAAGQSADDLIDDYLSRTGDLSFQGLGAPSPLKQQALQHQQTALAGSQPLGYG